jgi:L-fuculose-phosphate aldolase
MQNARSELLKACQVLDALGLNRGTSGNVSLRANAATNEAGFLITPSGIPVHAMHVDDLVWMDFSGHHEGRHAP